MKFQTLMIIKAVVCLVLGLPILVVPVFFYSLFGATLNEGGIFAAREYGASLIGNMLLTWYGKNEGDTKAHWAICAALCVYDALGFIVTLIAQLTGVLGPLGWMAVVIYLFFAVGFGYFLLQKK